MFNATLHLSAVEEETGRDCLANLFRASLPSDIDAEMQEVVTNIFCAHLNDAANFEFCVKRAIPEKDLQARLLTIADQYLPAKRNGQKANFLENNEGKLLQQTREKRLLERPTEKLNVKRRRLNQQKEYGSMDVLEEHLPYAFHTIFIQLGQRLPDEEMIHVCQQLAVLLKYSENHQFNQEAQEASLEHSALLVSLLLHQNLSIAELAWECLAALLRCNLKLKKSFATSSQLEIIISLVTGIADKYKHMQAQPRISAAMDKHIQAVLALGCHCLLICSIENANKICDLLRIRVIDWLIPLLKSNHATIASMAFRCLSSVKELVPVKAFDIEHKGFELFACLLQTPHPDVVTNSLMAIRNLLNYATQRQRMAEEGWHKVISLLRHENVRIVQTALLFFRAIPQWSIEIKNDIETLNILSQLPKAILPFLKSRHLQLVETACSCLSQLIMLENLRAAFFQLQGVEKVKKVLGTFAEAYEIEKRRFSSIARECVNHETLALEAIACYALQCLERCGVDFLSASMATEITRLLLHLTHSTSERIARLSICRLGSLSAASLDRFHSQHVPIGLISYETLLAHSLTLNEKIVEAALWSLKQISWQEDVRIAIAQRGGIKLVYKHLQSLHEKIICLATACVASWITTKNSLDEIDFQVIQALLGLLDSERESVIAETSAALKQLAQAHLLSDEMGSVLIEKCAPLLVHKHEPIVVNVLWCLGFIAKQKDHLRTQVVETKVMEGIQKTFDTSSSTTLIEAACACFYSIQNLVLAHPKAKVYYLAKLLHHRHEKIIEGALLSLSQLEKSMIGYAREILPTCLASIVRLLEHRNSKIVQEAILCLLRLSNDSQCQDIVYASKEYTELFKTATRLLIRTLNFRGSQYGQQEEHMLAAICLGRLACNDAADIHKQHIAELGGIEVLAQHLKKDITVAFEEALIFALAALSNLPANREMIGRFLDFHRLVNRLPCFSERLLSSALHLIEKLSISNVRLFELQAPKLLNSLHELVPRANSKTLLGKMFMVLNNLFNAYPILTPESQYVALEFTRAYVKSHLEGAELIPAATWLLSLARSANVERLEIQMEILQHGNQAVAETIFTDLKQSDETFLLNLLSQRAFFGALSQHFSSSASQEILAWAKSKKPLRQHWEYLAVATGNQEDQRAVIILSKDASKEIDQLFNQLQSVTDRHVFMHIVELISLLQDLLKEQKPCLPAELVYLDSPTYASLYRSKKVLDAFFVVEGKHISSHKNILADGSAYFEAMFTNGWKESAMQHTAIEISDIKHSTFEKVIEFLYLKKCAFESIEDGIQLFKAADMLQVPQLKELCQTFLLQHISKDSAAQIMEMAEKTCSQLQMAVIQWSVRHYAHLSNELKLYIQKEWQAILEILKPQA